MDNDSLLVQLDDKWVVKPDQYKGSGKNIKIQPRQGQSDLPDVEYDIGNGSAGSEAFNWTRQ